MELRPAHTLVVILPSSPSYVANVQGSHVHTAVNTVTSYEVVRTVGIDNRATVVRLVIRVLTTYKDAVNYRDYAS